MVRKKNRSLGLAAQINREPPKPQSQWRLGQTGKPEHKAIRRDVVNFGDEASESGTQKGSENPRCLCFKVQVVSSNTTLSGIR